MSVSVKYKGAAIAEMAESGTKTLKTGGMYCEEDIIIEHTAGAAADPSLKRWELTVSTGYPASGAILTLMTDDWLKEHRTEPGLHVLVAPKAAWTGAINRLYFFYSSNTPYLTASSGTTYHSIAQFSHTNAPSNRNRTKALSSPVEDVGDIDIASDGALRVVATSSYQMAPGDYTVLAWIDR